jgi:hypothetical protein
VKLLETKKICSEGQNPGLLGTLGVFVSQLGRTGGFDASTCIAQTQASTF